MGDDTPQQIMDTARTAALIALELRLYIEDRNSGLTPLDMISALALALADVIAESATPGITLDELCGPPTTALRSFVEARLDHPLPCTARELLEAYSTGKARGVRQH